MPAYDGGVSPLHLRQRGIHARICPLGRHHSAQLSSTQLNSITPRLRRRLEAFSRKQLKNQFFFFFNFFAIYIQYSIEDVNIPRLIFYLERGDFSCFHVCVFVIESVETSRAVEVESAAPFQRTSLSLARSLTCLASHEVHRPCPASYLPLLFALSVCVANGITKCISWRERSSSCQA